MADTPRKRRVGIAESPDVRYVRTPSPKRGKLIGEHNEIQADAGPGDFAHWNADELADFMRTRGCTTVAAKFINNNITGKEIPGMTCRTLEQLGLNNRDEVQEALSVLRNLCPWIETPQSPESTVYQKVFNDPIHGHIEVHPLCVKIIDTPQFQRLRNIKQLGGCYFVFPGASHNRFEHSIGTSYLAGRLVTSLRKRQPELNITKQDVLCVRIAGLCHDMGHGPFSHTFDGRFIPQARPDISWKHEQGSVDMFDHLMEVNNMKEHFTQYDLTDRDISFIKELIAGPQDSALVDQEWPYKGRGPEKSYLYEIVANKRTGIDVDKFDYFARDCHSLGIKSSFDHSRYMKFARVISVDKKLQICMRDKEAGNIYDMFNTRNCLFRRAYQHKTCNIIETMITEALLKADRHLRIPGKAGKMIPLSETIDDMEAFTKMTDSIYHSILCSPDPKLEEARQIIHRIERRELYKCVGQTILKKHREQDEIPFLCVDIANAVPPDIENVGPPIEPDDIVVHLIDFDYGMRDRNPIDQVRFYEKHNLTRAMKVRKDQVSQMLPETFAEQHMRLYCKKSDQESLWKVRVCFFQWCQGQECTTPKGGDVMAELTPMKGSQDCARECSDVSQKLFGEEFD